MTASPDAFEVSVLSLTVSGGGSGATILQGGHPGDIAYTDGAAGGS